MKKDIKNKQNGFGLVEVLVSISIIVIVVVTFSQLSLYAFRNWENAQNKSIAYNLIQSTIEDLHDTRNINLNTEGTTWSDGIIQKSKEEITNGKKFTINTTVSDIPLTLNTSNGPATLSTSKKKVTITVIWNERNSPPPKTLTGVTYLTDWKGKY